MQDKTPTVTTFDLEEAAAIMRGLMTRERRNVEPECRALVWMHRMDRATKDLPDYGRSNFGPCLNLTWKPPA